MLLFATASWPANGGARPPTSSRPHRSLALGLQKLYASGAPAVGEDGTLHYAEAGSSRGAVLRTLGAPDEIERMAVAGKQGPADEIWKYGVTRPGGFATAGALLLTDGEVRLIWGGKGAVIPAGLMSDTALRRLLQQIDDVSDPADGAHWQPGRLIVASNALRRLGRARALAVVGEYCRAVSSARTLQQLAMNDWVDAERSSLFPLLRLTFALPNVDDPRGGPFPVRTVAGIPLIPTRGAGGSGDPYLDRPRFRAYQSSGQIIPGEIRPTLYPATVISDLVQGSGPFSADNLDARQVMVGQVLRLLGTVPQPGRLPERASPQELLDWWKAYEPMLRSVDLRWSTGAVQYSRAR